MLSIKASYIAQMKKILLATTLFSSFTYSNCFDSTLHTYKHDEAIETEVIKRMDRYGLRNISFLVGDKNGIRYSQNFGSMSTPDSIYDLSSLTKLFTATATMQLLEASDKYSVWSPLREFLPQRYSKYLKLDHLLRHRSGFPAGLYGKLRTEEGLLKVRPYAFPRGQFKYSDVNYMLLAKVVEKMSKKSFDQYLIDHIFSPLEMDKTLFNPLNDYRVLPSMIDTEPGVVHDPVARKFNGIAGHAGIFSNLIDLAKFSSVFLNKGKYCEKDILSEKTVNKMTRSTSYSSRGLGFDVHSAYSSKPRSRFFTYKKSFGHTGYAGASLWIDKKKGLFAIFLGNATYSKKPQISKNGFYSTLSYLTKKIDVILESQKEELDFITVPSLLQDQQRQEPI